MVDELGITPPEPLPVTDLEGLLVSRDPRSRVDERRS
jgi:hypothetical protein